MKDKNKLIRVLKYLKGTENQELIVSAVDYKVLAFVDASYGSHPDAKGHTGVMITLGRGPIYIQSTKQKLVAKSSTEAELIAVSDAISQVLWIRDFILYLGYNVGPAIVFQDNTSTMTILENGIANGRNTKHINIRYYFVRERIEVNEIKLVYLYTRHMIADMLTKPLTKEQFSFLRDLLVGSRAIPKEFLERSMLRKV